MKYFVKQFAFVYNLSCLLIKFVSKCGNRGDVRNTGSYRYFSVI